MQGFGQGFDAVSGDRLACKLAKLLEGYRVRIQWSVFECRLRPQQLHRLRQMLERIAEPADSLRLWALPARAAEPVQLGREVELPVWQDKVI